ncbi:heme A synthase [Candidatus Marinamargulisbacteria bacterium SCGC AG-343-K17]|nr:heme A synthase [Candidatus Marinamargulisbacteria bacterium SCGC AG-343-K17]
MKQVKTWLLICLGLIAGIVMVGGATRLTGSGLSMVDWRPIMGSIPPITAAAWDATFSAYQQSPEFQKINFNMTLGEFKSIFFWEYLHRMLGRLIGLVAIIPFIYFSIKKALPRGFSRRWLGIIALIGCQGLMGWYMVKSGLVDNPHVSHFRLAAHLSLAFIIFLLIFVELLKLQFPSKRIKGTFLSKLSKLVFGLIGCQVVYGAFTAGLKAGHYYNTYPKMGPDWLPDSALMYGGGLINNMLNNPIMIQWVHRWFGVAVVIGVLILWLKCKDHKNLYLQYSGLLLVAVVGFQFILGVITLLTRVWLPVALAHQLGALLLLSASTLFNYFSTRTHQ